ncbi:hypothetical protein BVX98_01845 [bacterium F11]|nr:hypothetical protein BVX98_01845 [bacterium F11]
MNIQTAYQNQSAVPFKRGETPLSLPDILTSGSVRPGFYVMSGTRSLAPMLLDRLVGFLQREMGVPSGRLSMWTETGSTDSLPFEKKAKVAIGKLMWIDSGNIFDPYHMARVAAQRGLSPVRILRSLQVARPFTAFQLQQMLKKIPNPTQLRTFIPDGQAGSVVDSQLMVRVPLVIISDLMSLFYDPEIQERDVQRAFRDFMRQLSFLKTRAVVLALHPRYAVPKQREHFLPTVLNLADRMVVTQPPMVPAFESFLNGNREPVAIGF